MYYPGYKHYPMIDNKEQGSGRDLLIAFHLFIYGVYRYAVSSSGYIVSICKMISE
jgi:hypothetical protein